MNEPYEVRIHRGVRIPTGSAGASLGADLFLPAGAGPVPAVVSVLPYRRDVLGGAGCWTTLRRFAAAGYAAVLVDCRGLGSSDGPARAPFDPAEADDGVAAVEWAARQPWCSGPVGMWGFSWGAALALRTATRRPEPLRAVVSLMGMLDPERDFVHPGGLRGAVGPLGIWGLGTLVNQLLPPLADHHDPAERRRWLDRIERAEPYLVDVDRHPPGHDVWRGRTIDATAVTVPTLSVGGWRDMFADAAVRIHERVRGPRALLMGPWMHSAPDDAADEPVDATAAAVRWWDRWLAGWDAPTPPVTVYVQGHDPGWRTRPDWPGAITPIETALTGTGATAGPEATAGAGGTTGLAGLARTAGHPGHAGPAGAGGAAGPAATAGFTGTAAPDATVGTLSGLWGIPNGGFGRPLDQHEDDTRSAAFTGPPLAAPLLVAGRPVVTLTASGRLVVKLTDVDPAGRSTLVTGAVVAAAQGRRTVELDPTCYRFGPGHRLRVVVSDSAFPRVWPGRDGPPPVRDLRLRLPVPVGDEGRPVEVERPPPVPYGDWVTDTPRWEIVRDHIGDRVTVVVGDALRAELPGGHTIGQDTEIRASAARDAPGTAELRGTFTAEVALASGEQVQVRAELLLTEGAGAATGAVSVDGVTVAVRNWSFAGPPEPGRGDERGQQERAGAGREQGVVAGDQGAVAAR